MNAKSYNVILFTNDLNVGAKGFVKYRKVSSIQKFKVFANQQFPKWTFATIYDNETKEKIEVIKRA